MARRLAVILTVLLYAQDGHARLSCFHLFSLAYKKGLVATARYATGNAFLSELEVPLSLEPLQKLGFQILDRYDPKKHFFVGLGRSPFVITDFIEEVQTGSTATVPLAYNSYIPWHKRLYPYAPRKQDRYPYSWAKEYEYVRKPESEWGWEKVEKDVPHYRENLFNLLDEYFPPPATLASRKVVLTDFSDFGTSLVKFYADIDAWKKDRGHTFELEILFLQQRPHEPGEYWGDGKWEEHLFKDAKIAKVAYSTISLLDHQRLKELWDDSLLKRYSPYHHFLPTNPGLKPPVRAIKNPEHEKFVQALRRDFLREFRRNPDFRARVESFRN